MNAKGADYSHYQSSPDIAAQDFVFHKATQGVTYIDPTLTTRWAEARARGVPFVPYHFGDGRSSGRAQADFFIGATALNSGELALLDWEPDTNTPRMNMTPGQAEDFVNRIEGVTGRLPVVYTAGYFTNPLKVPTKVAACPLFYVAGNMPKAWKSAHFVQNKSGVSHGDEYLLGNADDVRAFIEGSEMTQDEFNAMLQKANGIGVNRQKDLGFAIGVQRYVNGDARPSDAAQQPGWDWAKKVSAGSSGVPAPFDATITPRP